MQTTITHRQEAGKHAEITPIQPVDAEVSDDLLALVAGGMMPPKGDPTYWGEDGFWDPYF